MIVSWKNNSIKTFNLSITLNLDYYYYYYLILENCLSGAVKLTKNTDIDKYKYSAYGTWFDRIKDFIHLVMKSVGMR